MTSKFKFLFLLFFFSFCAPTLAAEIQWKLGRESVFLKTDEKIWRTASQQDAGNKGIVVYVVGDETVDSWSELVTINYFKALQGEGVIKRLIEFTKKGLESQCAEVNWSTIEEDSQSALYRWSARACVGAPDQSELARISIGKEALYVLHYANKKVPIPEDSFTLWKAHLQEARIQS